MALLPAGPAEPGPKAINSHLFLGFALAPLKRLNKSKPIRFQASGVGLQAWQCSEPGFHTRPKIILGGRALRNFLVSNFSE